MKKLYLEYMAVAAAREYWGNKRKEHESDATFWGRIFTGGLVLGGGAVVWFAVTMLNVHEDAAVKAGEAGADLGRNFWERLATVGIAFTLLVVPV